MAEPQRKKRTKKVAVPLPEGFPAVGSYVTYYWEGRRMGTLISADGRIAIVTRPHKRNLTIPIEDVEIPKPQTGVHGSNITDK